MCPDQTWLVRDGLPGRAAHKGPVVLTVGMKIESYRIPTPGPIGARPVGQNIGIMLDSV